MPIASATTRPSRAEQGRRGALSSLRRLQLGGRRQAPASGSRTSARAPPAARLLERAAPPQRRPARARSAARARCRARRAPACRGRSARRPARLLAGASPGPSSSTASTALVAVRAPSSTVTARARRRVLERVLDQVVEDRPRGPRPRPATAHRRSPLHHAARAPSLSARRRASARARARRPRPASAGRSAVGGRSPRGRARAGRVSSRPAARSRARPPRAPRARPGRATSAPAASSRSRSPVSGVRSWCDALATKSRCDSSDAPEPLRHRR